MKVNRISIDIYGDNFSPKQLLSQIKGSYLVITSNEPDDCKWEDKDELYEFGFLSLMHPMKVGIDDVCYSEYENWYIEFLECNFNSIKACGGEDLSIGFEIFYNKQCNFEIFNKEILKRLAIFNVSIPVSVYNISSEHILDIIYDSGYDKETIAEIIEEG
jgi:hypothetical protein